MGGNSASKLIRKRGKLCDVEAFSADVGGKVAGGNSGLDLLASQLGKAGREGVGERLSALSEGGFDRAEEQLLALGAIGLFVVELNADDG